MAIEIVPGTDQSLSAVMIPIIGSDRVIGAIYLENYEREHAFTDANIRLMQTVASSMGVALENARLFEETQQRNSELALINSIQQGLAAELNFQSIVDLVGDKMREVFHTQDLQITWYDQEDKMGHTLYMYEHGKRLDLPPMPLTPGGIRDRMFKTRKAVIWNTMAEGDAIQPAIPGTDSSKSGCTIPIIVSDRVVGAIGMENYEVDYAYGASEIRLLTTIAGSLGAALENARLFEETQRLLSETEQRAAELQIINSVQAGLATKLDIQSIYELVGEKISEIFKSDTMLVATFDHATGRDSIVFGIEDGKRFFAKDEPFSQFEKHLIQTRKTVVINERAEERLVELGMEVIPGTSSSKSGVWVPLLAGDEVRGMISLQSNHRENAFSSTNVRLLETLANSMSVALENARLFNETQRLLKETEQRAAELAVINSVQAALAAELNMQGIYDTVGDKIREIFHNADVGIRVFDPPSGKVHHVFSYENGKRIDIEPYQLSDKGVAGYVIRTRQTLVVNENILERMEQLGSFILPGTNPEKSGVWVPLIVGDQARGLIELISQEKENAFSQSDVRLLETLANSMSVALENARLFDETQRLLKETEQRAAELADHQQRTTGPGSRIELPGDR